MSDEIDKEYELIETELESKPYVTRFYDVASPLGEILISFFEGDEVTDDLSASFCKSDIRGQTISIHSAETDYLLLLYDSDGFFSEESNVSFSAFALLQVRGKSLYVDILCTSEESRKSGKRYGDAMLKAIESYGKTSGFDAIELDSLDTAFGFYKKMGYTEVGEGVDGTIMRKSLKTGGGRLRLKTLRRSHNKEKKWDAVFEKDGKEKVVPFGQRGYSDFTKHKDTKRRQRYIDRHSGMGEDWKDPTTPGALSRYILWNKKTLRASLRDFKKKFRV